MFPSGSYCVVCFCVSLLIPSALKSHMQSGAFTSTKNHFLYGLTVTLIPPYVVLVVLVVCGVVNQASITSVMNPHINNIQSYLHRISNLLNQPGHSLMKNNVSLIWFPLLPHTNFEKYSSVSSYFPYIFLNVYVYG